MQTERWQRISGIFDLVADEPTSTRATLLAQLCGEDRALRHGNAGGVPVRFPDSVNKGAPLMDAHLSADERTLYFTRDRMIWSVPFDTLLHDAHAIDEQKS